jgi:hypothetical protein
MLIDGKDLPKKIVQLIEKETALGLAMQKMNERYDTAKNLNDQDEFKRIEEEGAKLEYCVIAFMNEKITIMTMAINRNKNFCYN